MDSFMNCHYIYVVDKVNNQGIMAFRPNYSIDKGHTVGLKQV